MLSRHNTFIAAGTIFEHFEDKGAALTFGEYGILPSLCSKGLRCSLNPYGWCAGISSSILEAGYGLDCLMAQFQGIDLRLPENWPGPAGFKWAATSSQV